MPAVQQQQRQQQQQHGQLLWCAIDSVRLVGCGAVNCLQRSQLPEDIVNNLLLQLNLSAGTALHVSNPMPVLPVQKHLRCLSEA
jgi:hypothetical protein